MSLEEKAREFARAIKETPECQNLNAAQARIKLDPTAQQIVTELEASQQRIQKAQAQGQPLAGEVQQLQLLEQKAMNNETLKKVFIAQEEFNKVMQKANKIIAQEIFS